MTDSHFTAIGSSQQPDEAIWQTIADKVDQLAAAWENAEDVASAPSLCALLADVSATHRLPVLWELIKIDLEHRWQNQRAPVLLEYYAATCPELVDLRQIPAEVIFEEVKVRSQAGYTVDLASLLVRFPEQAAALHGLLGTMRSPEASGAESTRPSLAAAPEAALRVSLEELREGDSIDEFDLLLLLGVGSFARVFLARQRSLERLVALKISKSVGTESRTLAQLDHPNIVRVFDQRSCQNPPVGLLYMELVPGGTFQDVVAAIARLAHAQRSGRVVLDVVDQRLAQNGTAPPEGSLIRRLLRRADWPTAVCHLGARLSDGLAYAHDKGILHRDIKPANVLITPEGSPKLADFNVSYQGGRADENPEDTFGGSLAYMSPEQLAACHPALGGSAQQVRAASDIYSLGVVLWELVVGQRPFEDVARSGGWTNLLQRMIDQREQFDAARATEALPRDCPPSLREVLRRCLSPRVADRYRSARQLADALQLCLHPRCWHLLQPPRSLLLRLTLRFPTLAVLLLTLLPSVVAAVFNFFYNDKQIIRYLDNDSAQQTFFRVLAAINAIAFPTGILITIALARRAARRLDRPPQEHPAPGGADVLLLGRGTARIALALWFISGLAYPLTLHFLMPSGITLGVYVHFLLSLALCGVLAGTYPFFFVTLLAIRGFVPALVRREIIRGPSAAVTATVRRLNRLFLVYTAFVPLLGILLVLLYSDSHQDGMSTARWLLIVASSSGLAGFGWMFWLHRIIDEDLLALAVLAPDGDEDLADSSASPMPLTRRTLWQRIWHMP